MCQITQLNICRLVQESFVSPTFDFGDVDISNDTFVYKVKKYLSSNEKKFDTEKITNSILVIKPHDLKIGKYTHELLWIHGNNKDVVFQGDLIITDKGNATCFPTAVDIKVVTENTVVNVAYSQNVIVVEGGGGISKTKTSQFTNDGADGENPFVSMQQVEAKGYTTFSGSYNDLTNKPTLFSGSYADLTEKPAIPTKTSELTNDSNFSTFSGDYNNLDNKPTLFSGSYTDLANKPTLFSGAYADLTGKPAIPTKTSELTNDSNFSTFSGDYNNLDNKPTLFSGSYTDLTNKPTLFSGAYADLTGKPAIPTKTSELTNDSNFSTFSGSYTDLTNKPALFSGNYNDLTNKPAIPTVGNGTITITQGGVSKGTFTTNQSGNTTIEVDAGSPVTVNNSTVTFKEGDITKGTMTTNQSSNTEVVLTRPGVQVMYADTPYQSIRTVFPGDATKPLPGQFSVDLSYSASFANKGATGSGSFVANLRTLASGAGSAALGINSTASGESSFSLGENTIASGKRSISLGWNCESHGENSFTGGYDSRTYGVNSIVYGYYIRAYHYAQLVIGRHNKNITSTGEAGWVDGSPIFTVGNGTTGSITSNAYQLYNDGKSEQLKDFEIQTIGQGVILKSPNGTRYRIKVDDAGVLSTETVV